MFLSSTKTEIYLLFVFKLFSMPEYSKTQQIISQQTFRLNSMFLHSFISELCKKKGNTKRKET